MNKIARGGRGPDAALLRQQIEDRDRQVANAYTKDAQVMAYPTTGGDRTAGIMRVAKPHRDPPRTAAIAVRLNILSRKTLGASRPTSTARSCVPTGQLPGLTLLARSPASAAAG